jgi:hypothetical protein
MTNSNEGGLVIIDLKSGKSRQVLKGAKVTQTDPSPTAISPPGPDRPAWMVATTLLLATSTREIEPSP